MLTGFQSKSVIRFLIRPVLINLSHSWLGSPLPYLNKSQKPHIYTPMERFTGRPTYNEEISEAEKETYDFLDRHDIAYETLCHEAAFTMEECAEVEKVLGAPICKNLFLCNRQQTQFYLLMLPGEKVFKTKFLSAELGCARLSFAGEELMTELLHIHPGAVSPMGLIHDKQAKVLLVVDEELLTSEYFGCHPCVNTASLKLSLKDLLDKVVPASGHEYRVIHLRTE